MIETFLINLLKLYEKMISLKNLLFVKYMITQLVPYLILQMSIDQRRTYILLPKNVRGRNLIIFTRMSRLSM